MESAEQPVSKHQPNGVVTHKRRRVINSCTECRRRKVKCDRNKPCAQCVTNQSSDLCQFFDAVPTSTQDESERQHEHRQTDDNSVRILGVSSTAGPSPASSTPSGQFHGSISKTRVYGHGHWMDPSSVLENWTLLRPVAEYFQAAFEGQGFAMVDDITESYQKCKQLARMIKNSRPDRESPISEIYNLLPDRELSKKLVEHYFATFGSCYRILHRAAFMGEFERFVQNFENVGVGFLLQLLVVMAIAIPFCDDQPTQPGLTSNAERWIYLAQTWLSAPLQKDRLSVAAIQIHCLLLLARQVNKIGSDLIWISGGSLMRAAIQIGLHQDPDRLEEMAPRHKETRRRLWYAILELDVQAALDSGISPTGRESDYDTCAPSPSDDNDFEKEDGDSSQDFPPLSSAQRHFQNQLAASLQLRLKLLRTINDWRDESPYETILTLSAALTSASRQTFTTIDSDPHDPQRGTPHDTFARSYLTHLLHRFSMTLHFRHAVMAHRQPLYTHSQKTCLAETLTLLALLDDPLYARFLVSGNGMFRDIITRGAMALFTEISSQTQTAGPSSTISPRVRAHLEPLMHDARRIVQHARDRLLHGDWNIKAYVAPCMMYAHVEAGLQNRSPREAVARALREGVEFARSTLEGLVSERVVADGLPSAELEEGSFLPGLADVDVERLFGDVFGWEGDLAWP